MTNTRPAGYYLVKVGSDTCIAEYMYRKPYPNGYIWIVDGRQFKETDFTYISPTPITFEKMSEIDEIIHKVTSNIGGTNYPILDILNKHKLI